MLDDFFKKNLGVFKKICSVNNIAGLGALGCCAYNMFASSQIDDSDRAVSEFFSNFGYGALVSFEMLSVSLLYNYLEKKKDLPDYTKEEFEKAKFDLEAILSFPDAEFESLSKVKSPESHFVEYSLKKFYSKKNTALNFPDDKKDAFLHFAVADDLTSLNFFDLAFEEVSKGLSKFDSSKPSRL